MLQLAVLLHALCGAAPFLGKGHVHADLVAEPAPVLPGKEISLGLRLRMDPGWHVYWRNPGDAGLAPSVRWTSTEGVRLDSLRWPVPDTIAVPPLLTYGYHDSLLILLPARVDPQAKAVRLRGEASWLECQEVCVPGKAGVSLDLPVGDPAGPDSTSGSFAAARAALPGVPSGWRARLAVLDSSLVLNLSGPGPAPASLRLFPMDPGVADNAAPQAFERTRDGFRLTVRRDPFVHALPDTLRALLVRPDGWGGGPRGWEIRIAPAPIRPQDTARAEIARAGGGIGGIGGFCAALALAFAGGLLLNLMPCVLPVLSLKAFSLLSGREERPLVHGLAYAAGVVLSFLALGALLLALRHGGHSLGWGFQMQSPRAVGALSVVMSLLALSLWGVFEPGASLQGMASNSVRGLAGSFLTGILATVVATPCTAPFMGSALGWALLQPAPLVLPVFAALGLGVAAPYVAISGIPALGRFLPRPGAWMGVVKQVLGFPLAATAVWLAWVAGRLAGTDATALLAFLWLAAGLGAWILGIGALPHRPAWSRHLARAAFAVLAGGSIAIAAVGLPSQGSREPVQSPSSESFRSGSLEELRASGRPWLLVFSADWCLSCQVNERTSIEIPPVREALRRKGVRLVHADWTARDTSIGRALESFGRQGVPLYVLSDGRNERILPELLAPSTVLSALGSLPDRR